MMPSAERCSSFLGDKNYNEFAFYIKIVEIEIHLNIYSHFLVFLLISFLWQIILVW